MGTIFLVVSKGKKHLKKENYRIVAYAVNNMAKFSSHLTSKHWSAVKKGT